MYSFLPPSLSLSLSLSLHLQREEQDTERNCGEANRNNHIKRNELIYLYLINQHLKESSCVHSRLQVKPQ